MLSQVDDLLTVDEACELMKIGHNNMYRLLKTGKLKAFRNGRVWRIPKAGVIEYIRVNAKII